MAARRNATASSTSSGEGSRTPSVVTFAPSCDCQNRRPPPVSCHQLIPREGFWSGLLTITLPFLLSKAVSWSLTRTLTPGHSHVWDIPATVQRLEYDPNRSAFIALVRTKLRHVSWVRRGMGLGCTVAPEARGRNWQQALSATLLCARSRAQTLRCSPQLQYENGLVSYILAPQVFAPPHKPLSPRIHPDSKAIRVAC